MAIPEERETLMSAVDEIRLNSGVEIRLQTLFQYRAYAGLLEGLPTRAFNERVVARALAYAREKLWFQGTPYLIPPVEQVLDLPRENWFQPGDTDQPIKLPRIVCLATFDSWSLGRTEDPEDEADGSQLNVIWFQPEFAFPIDDGVLAAFRALDWAAHATNFLY